MEAPHPLDPSRLAILKAQKSELLGSSNKVSNDLYELHQKRGQLSAEIRRIREDAQQNRMHAHYEPKIESLEKQIATMIAQAETLTAEHTILREKASAIGHLYHSCAEFMGVDPHA